MGFDIGGAPIAMTGTDIALSALVFTSSGHGTANPYCGYLGCKQGGQTYSSGASGWEIVSVMWSSGLNTGNGVFTCPVDGIYAMGLNGIINGGSGIPAGYSSFSYAGFGRNGGLSYFVHTNLCPNTVAGYASWSSGGTAALFQCVAGDTLALWVNRAPSPVGPDSISQNTGLYPDQHHGVWCKLVG